MEKRTLGLSPNRRKTGEKPPLRICSRNLSLIREKTAKREPGPRLEPRCHPDMGRLVQWEPWALSTFDEVTRRYLQRYLPPLEVTKVTMRRSDPRHEPYYELVDFHGSPVQVMDGRRSFHSTFFVSA